MASLSTNFKHILFHMAGVSTKKGICRYIVHGYYIFGSLKIVAGLMLAPKSESLDKTFQIFFSKMLPLNKKKIHGLLSLVYLERLFQQVQCFYLPIPILVY